MTKRLRDGTARSFGSRRTGRSGDAAILDHPQGLERAWAALANPNAGELIISAAAGWEFADLAGRHHSGGGSHGSLLAGDSEVPMLTVGLESAAGLDRRGDARGARALRRRIAGVRSRAGAGVRTGADLAATLRRRGIADARVLAAIAACHASCSFPRS